MTQERASQGVVGFARAFLCVLMALVLATSLTPLIPEAYAANEDKPESVIMQFSGDLKTTNVMKQVATLDANMGKGITIMFDVKDKYNNLASADRRRYIVAEDESGTESQLSETSTNRAGVMSEQLIAGQKLKLVTSTKDKSGVFVKRYEQQLNVRVINTKKAEQKPSGATDGSAAGGISKDGSTWSFTNGLEVKLQNTGFKFLDGTSINLGSMMLPLKYKHKTDGTTIVGINCSPDNSGYELNNTEFVSTWEVVTEKDDSADDNGAPATKASPSSAKTGDQMMLMIVLALIALALISAPVVIRSVKKTRNR